MSVVFETERLIARDWSLEDADAAFAIFGDPEVARYLGATGEPVPSLEVMVSSLERRAGLPPDPRGFGNWALELRETGDLVGGVALTPLEGGPDIELSYHLARKHWGNGYATEGARGILTYAFEQLELPVIVGVAYPENTASHRVMERLGMKYLGKRFCYGHELEHYVLEQDALEQDALERP